MLFRSPALAAQFEILNCHVRELHAFYGEFMGVRIARKHTGWYLQQHQHPRCRQLKQAFNTLGTPGEQLHLIDQIFHILSEEALAA